MKIKTDIKFVSKKNKRKFARGPQSIMEKLLPYFFAGPVFLFYLLMVLIPLGNTFWLSLFEWNGVGAKTFNGFNNFIRAIQDPIAIKALSNNIIWVVLAVTVPVSISLFLVVLLSSKINEGLRLFFRTVYYIPAVVALVVTSIIWEWIYNPVYGALNTVLRTVGLPFLASSWLGDSDLALYAVFLASVWASFGFILVILLAAVQKIDPTLYEAARIDGANGWQQFRNITLPSIRNEMNFVVIITAINAFKVFDMVYVMTGGGPYYSTEVVATFIYRKAFVESMTGYASAIAVILTIIVASLSTVSLYLRERKN